MKNETEQQCIGVKINMKYKFTKRKTKGKIKFTMLVLFFLLSVPLRVEAPTLNEVFDTVYQLVQPSPKPKIEKAKPGKKKRRR